MILNVLIKILYKNSFKIIKNCDFQRHQLFFIIFHFIQNYKKLIKKDINKYL